MVLLAFPRNIIKTVESALTSTWVFVVAHYQVGIDGGHVLPALLKLNRLRNYEILIIAFLHTLPLAASTSHDASFWRTIRENNFAVPPHESVGDLALEIAELAAETDPVLRDKLGYEILAAWVYRQHLLSGEQLEALRRKLVPAMTFHIGESDTDTVFRRSFSALYMSILAAQDLREPFLSSSAFKETLDSALRCYAEEKDLRGYVPEKGWAHATAHVADLLKFLGRNPKLSVEDQKRMVAAIAQRCRTVPSVLVWGEDARMAAALLSLVADKGFEPSIFDDWFHALVAENKHLWKAPKIDIPQYVSVRTQSNVLAQLLAKMAAEKGNDQTHTFQMSLSDILNKLDHPDE